MEIGRKNIKFAWIWILLGLLLGMFLEFKLSDPNWGKDATQFTKMLLKTAKIHGLLLAFLNLFYGLMIDNLNASIGMKKAGSWLILLGTVIFSGALFLATFSMKFAYFAPLGAVCCVLAILIMIIGQCRSTKNIKI